jgi:hypothetical protein
MLYADKITLDGCSTAAAKGKLFAICGNCYWCTSIIRYETGTIKQCPQCKSEQNILVIPLAVDINPADQAMALIH